MISGVFSGTCVVAAFMGLLSSMPCFPEGTRQLKPDSNYTHKFTIMGLGSLCFGMETCDPDHRLWVHIKHPGEKIYMGIDYVFSPVLETVKIKFQNTTVFGPVSISSISGPGNIQFFSQAYAGPDVLNVHGYPALSYAPQSSGDYEIDFDPGSKFSKMDITVIDTTVYPLQAIDGRLWAKKWIFDTESVNYPVNSFLGTMYIYTDDSIVTSIYFNRMQGHDFSVSCNANGCYPPPVPWDSACKSTSGEFVYPQYKIFVNNPDSTVYPTGMIGTISAVSVTPYCNGTIRVHLFVGKSGKVKSVFNINPLPGIQPEDVVRFDSVYPGWNDITWDGKNGLGQATLPGTQLTLELTYINGLTNLPIWDVERNVYGFVISQVRPPGPGIATYWNDTLLASKGGKVQLSGCISWDTIGCHSWEGNYLGVGIGSQNTVNTWWYATTSPANPIALTVHRPPLIADDISGPLVFCQSAVNSYTIVPDPIIGADSNKYEWVLTDDATSQVLLDLQNHGPSVTIPFSSYPAGTMHLKVRAGNNLCGYGPYGPGIHNDGIQLTSNTSPRVTNTVTSYTICSGGTTNISLQSTVSGTTYFYTASATGDSVTGYSNGILNPIQQILSITGNVIDSVIYRVVPYAASCPGDTAVFYAAVVPVLRVTNSDTSCQVCSGETTNIVLNSNVAEAGFSWTASGSATSVSGYFNSSGSTIAQPLVNTGAVPQTVTYMVTPSVGPCSGEPKVFTVKVMPGSVLTVAITATANPVCGGTPVTFTANAGNAGNFPLYQWKVNANNANNASNAVYTYIPSNGDIVSCTVTSSETCTTGNPATSAPITMTVNPYVPVSLTIAASANTFCTGSEVTFTASAVNAGSTPAYQWKVNASNAGNASNTIFIYAPSNGDVVSCEMTSSLTCVSGSPATSNTITMTATPLLPAGVTVSASANPFCTGSSVTFTANACNAGSTPGYQWKVNGINATNATNASYAYNANNGDVVTCVMTSNLNCVTSNPATSPPVTMIARALPTVSFTNCFDTVTFLNAKPYRLKGGLPAGGQYSGPGVNSATGFFTPSSAGTGLKNITYGYTNVYTCMNSATTTILVKPTPSFTCGGMFTDPRDNKVYSTVLIGTQCWMNENLSYGTEIPDNTPQTDNCLPEKYLRNFSFLIFNSVYQWDELMRYETSPGTQGLCPPGWHVPTEAEWIVLLNNYSGPGQAGTFLKDLLMPNGFDSYQYGFLYQNNLWSFTGGDNAGSMYWTSTASGSGRAIARGINNYLFSVSRYEAARSDGFSVRCIWDGSGTK